MALKMKAVDVEITKDAPKKGVNYEQHLKTKPIVGAVTSQHIVKGVPQATEVAETETIHPGIFGNGMTVSVEGGRTLNLGNYESARVGVTVTVPCDAATLNQAYDWATEWISEKIEEAVKEAKGNT